MAPLELTALAASFAHPAWEPYRGLCVRIEGLLEGSWDARLAVLNGLARGAEVRFAFAPQVTPLSARAYAQTIEEKGTVPLRDCAHDLCQALVWLRFPRTKFALNRFALRADPDRARTRPADRAAHFDESGVLLRNADASRLAALSRHDWLEFFGSEIDEFAALFSPVVFGHGLLEKLARPFKAMTGFALAVDEPLEDRLVCPELEALAPGRLLPLPIAGIPGWWPGQDAAFYADAAVFRPLSTPTRSPLTRT